MAQDRGKYFSESEYPCPDKQAAIAHPMKGKNSDWVEKLRHSFVAEHGKDDKSRDAQGYLHN